MVSIEEIVALVTASKNKFQFEKGEETKIVLKTT